MKLHSLNLKKTFLLFFSIICITHINANSLQVDDLEDIYREGLQLEQLRLYPEARQKYLQVTKLFFKDKKQQTNHEIDSKMLPVIIGSGVRLSIVTAKDNYHNMYQLVHQIEMFKASHTTIENVLDLVVNLRHYKQVTIPKTLYSDLLFSRAYNRIAWANKLLLGIPWKNYIVFPPQDIIGMVQLAMVDLEAYLEFQGVAQPVNSLKIKSRKERKGRYRYDRYLNVFQKNIDSIDKESLLFRTKELINSESNKDKLAMIEAKRAYYQGYKLTYLYRSKRSQTILNHAKSNYTLDAILSDKNERLFSLFNDMISLLHIPL